MTNETPSGAPDAMAAQYVRLYALPANRFGNEEFQRCEDIKDRAGFYDAHERAAFYAAAVRAIDPHEILGPYLGTGSEPMTPELFAFETWRRDSAEIADEPVVRLRRDTPRGEMTRLLILISDLLLWSLDSTERQTYYAAHELLVTREITAADFPHFDLRRHLQTRGVNLADWDAECARRARAEDAEGTFSRD